MKMLPPYTQTLFVELIRFSPGQPDGLYSNGHSHRHNGTSSMGRQAIAAAPSGHSRHHAPVHPPPPMATFVTDRPTNMAIQPHIPPPPPWSRWSTMTVPATQPLSHPAPPSSKKRKFVDSTPSGIAESSSSIKRSKPPTPKSQTPKPQTPSQVPSSSGPSSRSPQTVSSPSLAKVLGPSDSQPSSISAAPMHSMNPWLTPTNNSTPSRTSTPIRSVKLVVKDP